MEGRLTIILTGNNYLFLFATYCIHYDSLDYKNESSIYNNLQEILFHYSNHMRQLKLII